MRLEELRQRRQRAEARQQQAEATGQPRTAPAAAHEKQLLQLLLADPGLVPAVFSEVTPGEIQHLGLQQMLEGLYALHKEGEPPTLDLLRARKLERSDLAEAAMKLQEVGRANRDHARWLRQLMEEFRRRRLLPLKQELHNQLHAVSDHAQALELLRRVQNHTVLVNPGDSPDGDAGS